ncbi:MAG: pyridoxal-dependent decarboxylase [Acidobacteriota bacterium]|nr:pyridoxal-dependent decarboxylase [Acidobacteriota bacterium]
MTTPDLSFMHPYFLGAYAENDKMVESILLEFFRDHAYWRRNFHPENRPPIPTKAAYREDFNDFVAAMQQELHTLSADLKKSVPFFSPRYLGHMAADLLIPGVLAQMMTILYNPNNVSDDAAPATLQKELDVGQMLAKMVGFNIQQDAGPVGWGHLTSGGTVANYEGLWSLRAVKFYPVSLAEACRDFGFDPEGVGPLKQNLSAYTKWELFNLTIRETHQLMQATLSRLKQDAGKKDFQRFTKMMVSESLECLGMAGFFMKHTELKPPKVIVPISAHYSWEKACKVLGIGHGQLIHLGVDEHMRGDMDHLEEAVKACHSEQQPILCAVGVLGSTEFGSVDPIHRIVEIRDKYKQKGLHLGIHVDGAWGGYMACMFRNEDGTFAAHEECRKDFKYFPHEGTWKAFRAVSEVDSVTIDPHKLGYMPFGCGAFVSRDAGILDFISQEAAYVFDLKDDPLKKPPMQKLRGLGQYIMEGSKPGAAAAAAYISHRVIPLHRKGFGRVLTNSMQSCEYLYDKLYELRSRVSNLVTITIPYTPDSNLICYCINPKRNKYLALMNHFSRKIFNHMKIDPNQPLQGHDFFGSFTSLQKSKLNDHESARILEELGIDVDTFVDAVEDRTKEADHIYMVRHTLMNPWLMHREEGDEYNYLDRFCQFLERSIIMELDPSKRR